jgi:hypothetical protein
MAYKMQSKSGEVLKNHFQESLFNQKPGKGEKLCFAFNVRKQPRTQAVQ